MRNKIICPEGIRYYDIKRHWTKKIEPHLANDKVQDALVTDFNKFTFGRWKQRFKRGDLPQDFESCVWGREHKGPMPRFWQYVKHGACHWLVNFNLELAMQVEPNRIWRIVTSQRHSTVWDGNITLFDMNFFAEESFNLANEKHLPPGRHLKVHFPNQGGLIRRGVKMLCTERMKRAFDNGEMPLEDQKALVGVASKADMFIFPDALMPDAEREFPGQEPVEAMYKYIRHHPEVELQKWEPASKNYMVWKVNDFDNYSTQTN
jgi:hypothetical protein